MRRQFPSCLPEAAPRRVATSGPSYWHGWSPDGSTLAFARLLKRPDGSFDIYDIYTVPAAGGPERRLTETPGIDDGPDYTPRREVPLLEFRAQRGDEDLADASRRLAAGASDQRPRLRRLVSASLARRQVDCVHVVRQERPGASAQQERSAAADALAGGKAKIIATLFGGQGTINVPSWSPDSKYVAFVSYRDVLP